MMAVRKERTQKLGVSIRSALGYAGRETKSEGSCNILTAILIDYNDMEEDE